MSFWWAERTNPGTSMVGTAALPARVHTCVLQESKTIRVTGTKRRRDSQTSFSSSALSNRVTRLARSLKASNPTHVDVHGLQATVPMSTTGTLYALPDGISQGDDFYQRFGNHVDMSRLILKGAIVAGSTSTGPAIARISVFRAQSGVTFAANMTGSYSPILSSVSTQLLYDKFYTVPAALATAGFACNVSINLKLKHRQKFSGVGTSAQTGETLFLICQSNVSSGTAAPFWGAGFMEIYFKP